MEPANAIICQKPTPFINHKAPPIPTIKVTNLKTLSHDISDIASNANNNNPIPRANPNIPVDLLFCGIKNLNINPIAVINAINWNTDFHSISLTASKAKTSNPIPRANPIIGGTWILDLPDIPKNDEVFSWKNTLNTNPSAVIINIALPTDFQEIPENLWIANVSKNNPKAKPINPPPLNPPPDNESDILLYDFDEPSLPSTNLLITTPNKPTTPIIWIIDIQFNSWKSNNANPRTTNPIASNDNIGISFLIVLNDKPRPAINTLYLMIFSQVIYLNSNKDNVNNSNEIDNIFITLIFSNLSKPPICNAIPKAPINAGNFNTESHLIFWVWSKACVVAKMIPITINNFAVLVQLSSPPAINLNAIPNEIIVVINFKIDS